MGDGGVYEYVEPWYGFAVKKESDAQDYAVEFLRFMARQDELNTLALLSRAFPLLLGCSPFPIRFHSDVSAFI